MKKNTILWIVAFVITVIMGYYQRATGPTYPVKGKTSIGTKEISYKLLRSHGGKGNQEIKIETNDSDISGTLYYKRYKTNDSWTPMKMVYRSGKLSAFLPHQPPAGKLEYFLELNKNNKTVKFPKRSVVIRFKGAIPLYVLIPHILAMFLAMFFSTRTGFEYFNENPNLKKLTLWTLAFLTVGGLILGPIVQKFAFGEYWTGFPYGHDLTDNKTVIAFGGWLIALFMYGKSKVPKIWAVFASVILLLVYMIPHSAMGSELDYNKLDKQKSKTENLNSNNINLKKYQGEI